MRINIQNSTRVKLKNIPTGDLLGYGEKDELLVKTTYHQCGLIRCTSIRSGSPVTLPEDTLVRPVKEIQVIFAE